MCGPSRQEEQLQAQEQSLSTMMSAHYAERFGAQSDILQNLNNIFTPIAEAGPDQQGFGPNELAALRTQATEGVGTNYAKASRALNTTLAARGGGNEFLPTGGAAALRGQLASAAATQQSNEDLAITNANYATGRQKWGQAVGGLAALGSQYDPSQFGSLASGTNASAFGEASKITQEKNQLGKDIGAIAGAGLGALSGGIGNLDMTGNSTAAEQIGNFFGGM